MPDAVALIAHTEVGAGGASNITFSSIPNTFDDLLIFTSLRVNSAIYVVNVRIRFNGDTATNYSRTALVGYSGTTASSATSNSSTLLYGVEPATTATANTFGSSSIYIPAYDNTSNFKQFISDTTSENNSTTDYQLEEVAGLWRNTSAITSIEIANPSSNLLQYSSATLYGITKA